MFYRQNDRANVTAILSRSYCRDERRDSRSRDARPYSEEVEKEEKMSFFSFSKCLTLL